MLHRCSKNQERKHYWLKAKGISHIINYKAAIKPIKPSAPAAAPDNAVGLAAAAVVLGAKTLEAALTTLLAPLTPRLPTELAPLTATLPTLLAPLAAPPRTDVMVDQALLV